MLFIIVGVLLAVLGTWAGIHTKYLRHFLCGMCLTSIGALIALFVFQFPINRTPPLTFNYFCKRKSDFYKSLITGH